MRGQRKLAPELTLSAIHRFDNRPQYRRDSMTQLLNLEAFDGFIVAVILEASCAAHPGHPTLHFRSYQIVEDLKGSATTKLIERFEVRPGDCSANRWGFDFQRKSSS